jgi:hypothetical protein
VLLDLNCGEVGVIKWDAKGIITWQFLQPRSSLVVLGDLGAHFVMPSIVMQLFGFYVQMIFAFIHLSQRLNLTCWCALW